MNKFFVVVWKVLVTSVFAFVIWGVSHKALAGEMGKIDAAVRAEVARVYSEGEGGETYSFDEQDDIWGLELFAGHDEDDDVAEEFCKWFVEGFAKKPLPNGSATYEFVVCLNPEGSDYVALFLDDDAIADE